MQVTAPHHAEVSSRGARAGTPGPRGAVVLLLYLFVGHLRASANLMSDSNKSTPEHVTTTSHVTKCRVIAAVWPSYGHFRARAALVMSDSNRSTSPPTPSAPPTTTALNVLRALFMCATGDHLSAAAS